MGWYNELAMYALTLKDVNDNYIELFMGASSIISFVITILVFSFGNIDDDLKNGTLGSFVLIFIAAIIGGLIGGFLGIFLSVSWSIVVFYVLPVFLLFFGIYKSRDMVKQIKKWNKEYKRRERHVEKQIVKDTVNTIKCEELAKQAYESLKKDFPDIKYSAVLESIKKKL